MKETFRVYLVLRFLSSLGMTVASATYMIFLQSRGLNLFEANLMNVACWLTMFVCQVPTGLVADVFGRKLSFLVSCVLMVVGGLVYGSSSTMTGFIFSEILSALGLTFASGAFEAWVVDRLKEQGYTGTQNNITSRANLVGNIGGICGGLAGGVIAGYGLELPWFAMSVIFFFSGIYALVFMKETRKVDIHRGAKKWHHLTSTFCASLRYLRGSKELRFILVLYGVFVFAVQPLNMYWPPLCKELFASTDMLGAIKAGISLSLMAGAYIALRFGGGKDIKRSLVQLVLLIGLLVLCASFLTQTIIVLLPFFLHEIARGYHDPLAGAYTQEHLPDEERATIASMMSMVFGFTGALGLFVSGLIAEYASITVSWYISALSFIFIAIFYACKKQD